MKHCENDLIRFERVALGYENRAVLSDLSFCVESGQFLGIVGPNGAGKTTLLRGILRLLPAIEGRIVVHGQHDGDLHYGYVPQLQTVDEIYPLSTLDVALMGRYRRIGIGRLPGAKDREFGLRALEAAGVAELAQRPFRTLSGGQKQRVLIARALCAEPDLLVLDEPTSGMDLTGESSVMRLVRRLHQERHLTVIMVSHQLNTVARWVSHLGILHAGQLVLGPIDEVLTAEALQRVYGPGVTVETVQGQRIVLPPAVAE